MSGHTYIHTHTHTHTHTYTHDNYYNPRCAHAHRELITHCIMGCDNQLKGYLVDLDRVDVYDYLISSHLLSK